ncbi:hypothetical protein D0T66_03100 [Dysgonomonas sp. 25]|nr:hypothetical protein [Dysgonomonas sp. 25]
MLLIWILLYSFIELFSQDIQYKLYGKYLCNDSICTIDLYSLQKDQFKIYSTNDDLILLPDTGCYMLLTSYTDPRDTIRVNISNFGLNSDTIIIMSIVEYLSPSKNQGGWLCCEKKCEGYLVDYYNNGEKRIEGLFKKGRPVGEIRYYRINGSLMAIDYYNKKGHLIKSDFWNSASE